MRIRLMWMMIAAVALAMGCILAACSRTEQKPAGPPEKVTIAISATTDAVLAEVALVKGLFRQEGLEPTVHLFPYGKPALEDMLAGKADFATVAETPVMFAIMKGERIAIIATIQTSKTGNAMLARRDRGILAFGDLKGKKIGATLGTTSEFFLDAILGVHGISRGDVKVVDLKADAMADALARGDIDAISTFAPYTYFTQKKLGERAVTFQDNNIYRWNFNVAASQDMIHKNPEKVKKVLSALVKAEDFVRQNPAESQKIVVDFSRIEPGIVHDVWADASFAVTLDQALVLALEDESEWAIEHGLISATKVPNYLDYIYRTGLLSISPKAVRILK